MTALPRLSQYSFVDMVAQRLDLRTRSAAKTPATGQMTSRYELSFYGAENALLDDTKMYLLVAVGKFSLRAEPAIDKPQLVGHCIGEFIFTLAAPFDHALAIDPELHPYLLSVTEPIVRLQMQQMISAMGVDARLGVAAPAVGPVHHREVAVGTALPFESDLAAIAPPASPS